MSNATISNNMRTLACKTFKENLPTSLYTTIGAVDSWVKLKLKFEPDVETIGENQLDFIAGEYITVCTASDGTGIVGVMRVEYYDSIVKEMFADITYDTSFDWTTLSADASNHYLYFGDYQNSTADNSLDNIMGTNIKINTAVVDDSVVVFGDSDATSPIPRDTKRTRDSVLQRSIGGVKITPSLDVDYVIRKCNASIVSVAGTFKIPAFDDGTDYDTLIATESTEDVYISPVVFEPVNSTVWLCIGSSDTNFAAADYTDIQTIKPSGTQNAI